MEVGFTGLSGMAWKGFFFGSPLENGAACPLPERWASSSCALSRSHSAWRRALLFQFAEATLSLSVARAKERGHTVTLAERPARSCASFLTFC